jgi:hypothetical protein
VETFGTINTENKEANKKLSLAYRYSSNIQLNPLFLRTPHPSII